MDRSRGPQGNRIHPETRDSIPTVRPEDSIIRLDDANLLPVLISPDEATRIDRKTIHAKYYNSFNFSKLAASFGDHRTTLGITSANRGDGKTLVASNIAVSLATGYKQKTLLVDMNFEHPDLHTIFGTAQTPGMAEAIAFQKIHVVPSRIDHLYVMTTGDNKLHRPGIEHTLVLRQIFQTLKSRFDFIIIDMPSILPVKGFPVHFINEIDGLISVVDTTRTKKSAFGRIFNHIDESRFIGYVFNRESDV
ncbi:MAG: hypothetical protein WD115_05035 [Balneolaceae bacterium]